MISQCILVGTGARRRGFTLVEIVVALTILLVLGAIVIAADIRGTDRDRWLRAALVLDDIARAINKTEVTRPPFSFAQTVGANPSRLSQLTKPITNSELNSCKLVAFSGTQVSNWRGPYYLRELPVNGNFKVETGFVTEDEMIRVPATGDPGPYSPTSPPPPAALLIVMNNVAPEDAQGLAELVDGDATGTAGAVTFTLSGSSPITVHYRVEITGC
jgi:prepilin-type N-terminal cleavage/methylation domain-containing protein